MSFSCSNCQKEYKRISAYQKHYSICRIIRRKKTDDGFDDGDYGNMTKEEMGCILKDILIKYQTMEKKVNELTAYVSMKRKKINTIDWLNANRKVSLVENKMFDFARWASEIKINRNHLEYVFEHSFVKVFSHIISQIIEIEEEGKNIPICAFTHKDGSLYVYNNEMASWGYITNDQLKHLVSSIRVKINAEFKLWQDEHKEIILTDQTYRDLYLNNINKVMYTNYKNDEDLNLKIQRDLFNILKMCMEIII